MMLEMVMLELKICIRNTHILCAVPGLATIKLQKLGLLKSENTASQPIKNQYLLELSKLLRLEYILIMVLQFHQDLAPYNLKPYLRR